jgi:hypothetical protein
LGTGVAAEFPPPPPGFQPRPRRSAGPPMLVPQTTSRPSPRRWRTRSQARRVRCRDP